MAGFYPDVPDLLIPYDVDGTEVRVINDGGTVNTLVSLANKQVMLNYLSDAFAGQTRIAFLFPEVRDITGYYININGNSPNNISSSADTTNGFDGTWGTVVASPIVSVNIGDVPIYRTNIQSISTSTKAIRISSQFNTDWKSIHWYGRISTGQNPTRLRFWHGTTDTEVTGPHFDYGEITRLTTEDKTFRIKNNAASLTANSIVISTESAYGSTGSEFLYSFAGSAYSSSPINIGNLAAGAISGVITVRANCTVNAQPGLHSSRIKAVAASFT